MKKLECTLKACADKNRVRIIKLLQKKKMCVCELAYILNITQPSVSKHLKKLKKAGMIGSDQNGFWTDYYFKGGNKYSTQIGALLKAWLNEDKVIQKDLKKMEKADRSELCCK